MRSTHGGIMYDNHNRRRAASLPAILVLLIFSLLLVGTPAAWADDETDGPVASESAGTTSGATLPATATSSGASAKDGCVNVCDIVTDSQYVNSANTDGVGLLTEANRSALDGRAQSLTSRYDIGVYIVAVDDYTHWDSNINEAADDIYLNYYEFGVGTGRDGIMLLLSMEERDYAILTHGSRAQNAIDDYATGELEDTFLPDFRDDDWYGGFSHYLDTCGDYLERAANGNPVRQSASSHSSSASSDEGNPILVFLLANGVALAVCLVLRSMNKNVHTAASAASYAVSPVHLTQRVDQYTHTTTQVIHIESESSGGGGSSVSMSSGGSSVRSGKF